jgi:hypothetical protein
MTGVLLGSNPSDAIQDHLNRKTVTKSLILKDNIIFNV